MSGPGLLCPLCAQAIAPSVSSAIRHYLITGPTTRYSTSGESQKRKKTHTPMTGGPPRRSEGRSRSGSRPRPPSVAGKNGKRRRGRVENEMQGLGYFLHAHIQKWRPLRLFNLAVVFEGVVSELEGCWPARSSMNIKPRALSQGPVRVTGSGRRRGRCSGPVGEPATQTRGPSRCQSRPNEKP